MFVAAGDIFPVHLNSYFSTACLGDTRTATQSSNVPVDEPKQVERETQLPRMRKPKNPGSKLGLILETAVHVFGLKHQYGSTRNNPRVLFPI